MAGCEGSGDLPVGYCSSNTAAVLTLRRSGGYHEDTVLRWSGQFEKGI